MAKVEFEHLIELDKDGNLVPRLATGWRWLDDRTLEAAHIIPNACATTRKPSIARSIVRSSTQ